MLALKILIYASKLRFWGLHKPKISSFYTIIKKVAPQDNLLLYIK